LRDGGAVERAWFQNLARDLSDVISMNSADPDFTAAPVAVEAAVEALRVSRERTGIST